MSIAYWPEENDDGYIEGAKWVCGCCEYQQTISTEDMDPRGCNHCGQPTCVSCWTEIDYCAKCERETRYE